MPRGQGAAAVSARYRQARLGGCLSAQISRRADGATILRSTEPLGPYPMRLTDRLEHWASEAPDRVFAAMRERGERSDTWRTISYAQMLERARAVGQALVDRGLSPERPIAILSGNDLEHLTLSMGAMWAGVPFAPISPAYSLISRDFSKLRHVLAVTTPGMLFASEAAPYARAIEAVLEPDVELVLGQGACEAGASTPFEALLATRPAAGIDAAHSEVDADTIVKFLFTSGSTKAPKGVVTNHRMLCSNLQAIRQSFAFMIDEPPVLVDWLPWNHVFGGNHNVGIVLYNGGTLYIDEGKPTAEGVGETLRNLREIAPTVYFNVPRGFEEIAHAMDHDDRLRETLLSRVQAFMFAGAGLSQAVWDRLDAHAERTIGMRIMMLTGLGMTETAPSCTFALGEHVHSGHIGLPAPGVTTKLVEVDGKTEIRFAGPNVMPGYWREPALTAQAFDDEGFYRTGDAVRFVDPDDPQRGLLFDGRIAEDFKLSTGTFVSVGPLRARVISAGAPYVQDVVVAGPDRDDVGVLIFPRMDQCARLAGIATGGDAAQLTGQAGRAVLEHPSVRATFQRLLDRLWSEGTGSATRVARARLLLEPPLLDRGEVTDKGSINQRAVLTHRAALVDAMYDAPAGHPEVMLPAR
ncbi:MAG: feruloyl-CoA synthase [Burkholderiales bacterium]|nr:MAG: feruloyl-CoA synthase [Burkholderiales bacterium]